MEYYELLYQASVKSADADKDGGNAKKLEKHFVKIENSVRGELAPDRFEMAFIPYKASMWDSMQSIWRAAMDDPQCDVYTICAPYFEKTSTGTLGRIVIENKEFPPEVALTDWEKYDIDQRRPDVIVTHNPYDE